MQLCICACMAVNVCVNAPLILKRGELIEAPFVSVMTVRNFWHPYEKKQNCGIKRGSSV